MSDFEQDKDEEDGEGGGVEPPSGNHATAKGQEVTVENASASSEEEDDRAYGHMLILGTDLDRPSPS